MKNLEHRLRHLYSISLVKESVAISTVIRTSFFLQRFAVEIIAAAHRIKTQSIITYLKECEIPKCPRMLTVTSPTSMSCINALGKVHTVSFGRQLTGEIVYDLMS